MILHSLYRVEIHHPTQWQVPVSMIRLAVKESLAQARFMPGTVGVIFISNEEIIDLNRKFRTIDEATDVLTFPYREPAHIPSGSTIPSKFGSKPPIGDIFIAYDYAKIQSQIHDIPFEIECTILAIHGALHLAGYDDVKLEDQATMVKATESVWLSLGHESLPHWFTCDPEVIAKNATHIGDATDARRCS